MARRHVVVATSLLVVDIPSDPVVFIETKTRDVYKMVDGQEVREVVPYEVKRVVSLATVQAALGREVPATLNAAFGGNGNLPSVWNGKAPTA